MVIEIGKRPSYEVDTFDGLFCGAKLLNLLPDWRQGRKIYGGRRIFKIDFQNRNVGNLSLPIAEMKLCIMRSTCSHQPPPIFGHAPSLSTSCRATQRGKSLLP